MEVFQKDRYIPKICYVREQTRIYTNSIVRFSIWLIELGIEPLRLLLFKNLCVKCILKSSLHLLQMRRAELWNFP